MHLLPAVLNTAVALSGDVFQAGVALKSVTIAFLWSRRNVTCHSDV
jgi:hypothetical protein